MRAFWKFGLSLSFALLLTVYISACSQPKTSEAADESTPTPTPTPSPTPTPLAVNSKKVAVGLGRAFAINTSAAGYSWGGNYEASNNTYGHLAIGLSTNTTRDTPQVLNDVGETFLSIASGEFVNCAITGAQKVKCWGRSSGDGAGGDRYSPTLIDDGGTSSYIDIATGSYHSCAITEAGVMKCWGDGWNGKLGNLDGTGATQNSPVTAHAGTSFRKVAAGRNHTCGITTDGVLQCWGTNSAAQLGDGTTTTPRLAPVVIDPGVTYSEISAGENATCGITSAGVLKCWGANGSGQLGDSTTSTKVSPTVIDTGTSYAKISVGGIGNLHTCGVTTTGVLKCWGNNSAGQLGNASTSPSLVPIVIDSGVAYREVVANRNNTCGVTVGGLLKCWGNNSSGQLGIGGTTQQTSPALIGSGY